MISNPARVFYDDSEPDLQLQYFGRAVWEPDDVIEIRPLPSGASFWIHAGEIGKQLHRLERLNADGFNLYAGINPRRDFNLRGDEAVDLARCLFVDIDSAGGGEDVEAMVWRAYDAGFSDPTITLNSGHGTWLFWRLAEPMTDLAAWTAIQKGIITVMQGDRAIHNPERIGRLPGFWNWKPPAGMAHVVEINPDRRHTLASITAVLDQHPAASAPPAPQRITTGTDTHANLLRRARKYIAAADGVGEGQRNGTLFRLAGHCAALVGEGGEVLGEAEIVDLLYDFNRRCTPPLSAAELGQAVASAMKNGTAREPKPPHPTRRQKNDFKYHHALEVAAHGRAD